MPKFTTKSQEQILAAMIAKVIARTNLSDVGDASVLKHVLAAAAAQDSEQYYQMFLLLQLFSIDTAADDDLDARAKEIQPALITRLEATKSVGTAYFSRSGTVGTTLIPVGTRIKTSDGKRFSTTTVGTIAATSPEQITGHGVGRDSNSVSIVAMDAGAANNVAANTIIKFDIKPGGVDEVTNLSATVNGTDRETDDSFRARLKAYIASLPRCPVSAIEANVQGQQDPISGSIAMFVKVWEDPINRGNIIVYVDDGSGTAESSTATAVALAGTWTWAGTTTVLATNTSGVVAGTWIRKDSDGQFFEIQSIVPNTSVILLNPGADTIPTGAGASSKAVELLTLGLNGPPANTAVGGETTLWLNNWPIKNSVAFKLASSVNGNLAINTDYILNPASGQIDFIVPLITGEKVIADYTYYTGLIAFVQKLVDGDLNDRQTYPGLRAAGILAIVKTPQVLLQNVVVILSVSEGYDQVTVQNNVKQAIKSYINNLGISGDVILAELSRRMKEVAGVYDLTISTPAGNVTILDDQLARTTNSNLSVS